MIETNYVLGGNVILKFGDAAVPGISGFLVNLSTKIDRKRK